MTSDVPNLNLVWAELIVEELRRNGVSQFVISPGSRSTPLTVAAARNDGVETTVHFDERGAAFFALGYAKATGNPAALICTSGTATANYYPAVIEAAQSQTPMIILTADRPPELIDCGANQAINQTNLYGTYPRWFHDFGCPTTEVPAASVLTTVDQTVFRATRAPAGPVHLNCPYREPLLPEGEQSAPVAYTEPLTRWREGHTAYTIHGAAATPPRPLAVRTVNRSLVVVGALRNREERDMAAAILRQANWPVFADVTSGLSVHAEGAPFVQHYDQLLTAERFREHCRPDYVLHIGGAITSKRLQQHLAAHPPENYIRIADHPFRQDPTHQVHIRAEGHVVAFTKWVLEDAPALAPEWTGPFGEMDAAAKTVIENLDSDMNEASAVRAVSRATPGDATLFIGNSMPIRDLNAFGFARERGPWVIANRGASGIDGNIATAAGCARGSNRPVVAVLGDLAALHDLNSLALVENSKTPIAVVVINNDGGGIFGALPVSQQTDVFENYFLTPYGMGFEQAAAQFGLDYVRPKTLSAFEDALKAFFESGESTLIEVPVDREESARVRQRIKERIVTVIDGE